MKIALDLDEVLAPFLEGFIKFHNEAYKTKYKFDDFVSYNYWEIIGGTRKDAIKKVYDFYETNFFDDMGTVEGARDAVASLKSRNNELYIVTSRQNDFKKKTCSWVDKQFPDTFEYIYFTNAYPKDGSASSTKSYFCNSLGADVMVDDCLDYAVECISPERKVLLFKYPWNERNYIPSDIRMVDGWPEALSILQK